MKGQQRGEFNAKLDPETTAYVIHNTMVGLRVKVKAADDREKLQCVIDATMAMLKS